MDILQCLPKYGQRLDSEIAEETGGALAKVRERFAQLTGTGEVTTPQTDMFRAWQAGRRVPVPRVGLFPASSTRSETKAAGVGNHAISA